MTPLQEVWRIVVLNELARKNNETEQLRNQLSLAESIIRDADNALECLRDKNKELHGEISRRDTVIREASQYWEKKEKELIAQIKEGIRLIDEWKKMYKELKAEYDKPISVPVYYGNYYSYTSYTVDPHYEVITI